VLRLKDGENQILAGLVQDEDRRAASRVPGLGDLPILGRLFGSQQVERDKSEIVLSITPRLVRGIPRSTAADTGFDAGTASSVRGRRPEPEAAGAEPAAAEPRRVAEPGATVADAPAGAARP
jgi:general secretion pathway protein D